MAGSKDEAERALEAFDDVFADIVDGLLFDGEGVVREGDLRDAPERSGYPSASGDGGTRGLVRDVCKYVAAPGGGGEVRVALLALENQSAPDPLMPLRVIGYDGASYRGQLARRRGGGRVVRPHPVVTLVLNFDERPWPGPFRLSECLDAPGWLAPWVSDYELHVFDMCSLAPGQRERFRSDFRLLVEYLALARGCGRSGPLPWPDELAGRPVDHPGELFSLLSALGDSSYERAYGEMLQSLPKSEGAERTEVTMIAYGEQLIQKGREQGRAEAQAGFVAYGEQLIQKGRAEGRAEAQAGFVAYGEQLIQKGRAEGRAEGEARGETRGLAAAVRALAAKLGLSAEEAADMLDIPAGSRAEVLAAVA